MTLLLNGFGQCLWEQEKNGRVPYDLTSFLIFLLNGGKWIKKGCKDCRGQVSGGGKG